MRFGELKNILDNAIDENNQLIFSAEQKYGGHMYAVSNYTNLIKALKILRKQSWIDTNAMENVKELIDKNNIPNFIELNQENYINLRSLIKDINSKLPIFYSMLEEFVLEQEEQVINIKIPTNYASDFKSLNEFNKDIQGIFDIIFLHKGLRGDAIKLQGFDIGSAWYAVLLVASPFVFSSFLQILKIATESFKAKKEYYKSKEARLSYEVKRQEVKDSMKKSEKNKSDEEYKEHIQKMVEVEIKIKIDELLEKIEGKVENDKEEMSVSFSKGIYKIINLIDKGTEFHLSLNPPEYIEVGETLESLEIDYENIPRVLEGKKKEEIKQVEDKSGEEPTE